MWPIILHLPRFSGCAGHIHLIIQCKWVIVRKKNRVKRRSIVQLCHQCCHWCCRKWWLIISTGRSTSCFVSWWKLPINHQKQKSEENFINHIHSPIYIYFSNHFYDHIFMILINFFFFWSNNQNDSLAVDKFSIHCCC